MTVRLEGKFTGFFDVSALGRENGLTKGEDISQKRPGLVPRDLLIGRDCKSCPKVGLSVMVDGGALVDLR